MPAAHRRQVAVKRDEPEQEPTEAAGIPSDDPAGPTSVAAGLERIDRAGADAAPTAAAGPASRGATVMIGIPAYNEADSVGDVVRAAVDRADRVVVVDDGSADGTADRAYEAGASVIVHDENRGYGAALRTLFRHAHVAGVDHLVILDGDGQHDAADVPELVATQRTTGAEVIIGSRFAGGSSERMPLYRRFGLAVVNLLANASMRLQHGSPGVADTQSGFRAYSRDAIETIAEAERVGDGMDASLDILFQAVRQGYEIREVPTTIEYDVENASTHDPIGHGLTLLTAILREAVALPDWLTRTRGSIAAAVLALVLAAAVAPLRLFEATAVRTVTLLSVVTLVLANAARSVLDAVR